MAMKKWLLRTKARLLRSARNSCHHASYFFAV
ncbi:hypothetical protein YPC_4596 [Yersinia pestis biovar Medievalis str. Harbin 35]|nr:hypothetical protein YPC_4596 [Yersinia pestis biovar Medievalis str. Harbin 35]EEO74627.1 hypothetical protein YP516_4230 [Yersinia pestis Nepal516]